MEILTVQQFSTLGKYLKNKRVAAGLTQTDVSSKLGYTSAQFISNIERGLCAPPATALKRMVRLYKMPENELLKKMVEVHTNYWKSKIFGKKYN